MRDISQEQHALADLYRWVIKHPGTHPGSDPVAKAALLVLGNPDRLPSARPRTKHARALFDLLKWATGPHRTGKPFSHVEVLAAHVVLFGKNSLPSLKKDYAESHEAPGKEGAPLYDLTINGIYPKDVYDRLYQYGNDPEYDARNMAVIRAAHGNPDYRVNIWRAVPAAVAFRRKLGLIPLPFNAGDWVAISRDYARFHAEDLEGEGRHGVVFGHRAYAKEVFTDGASLSEWGYVPRG